MSDLTILCQNIDKSKKVQDRRLGLLYTCIGSGNAKKAVNRMDYSEETRIHLLDAIRDMPRLYFCVAKKPLKKFIYERSWDRFDYLLNLEKAQRIVFDYDTTLKIQGKMYFVDEIKNNYEPVFPEDLVIDRDDLIEAGYATDKTADKMLRMLVEETHERPEKNTRKDLLALAKKYKRNKFAAFFRGVTLTR